MLLMSSYARRRIIFTKPCMNGATACPFGDRLQGPKPDRMQYWMRDDILTAADIYVDG